MVKLGEYIDGATQLPYVAEGVKLRGRTIFLLPLFSNKPGEWFAFLPSGSGRLQRVALVDVIQGSYIAAAPIDPSSDFCLPLANLVFQQMSFSGVARPLMGLEDAIEGTASLLDLYEIVSNLHTAGHPGASQLTQALVNQLFVVSRSLFDVLQSLCRAVCSVVKRLDDPGKPLMKNLPTSFARVALHGDKPRSTDEISAKYGMPEPIAKFYRSQAPFLADIRQIRDGVIHRGHNVGYVMNLDEGLAVPTRDAPWNRLEIWDGACVGENELGSLRRLFAHVIHESAAATTRFAETFFSCIDLPAPISPGNRVFLRSPLNHYLIGIHHTLASPWERI